MIEYGKAKQFSEVTLQDHQRHLIWTSAHDDGHDEEWEKPIVSATEVTQEIVAARVIVPIITVRVEGTDLFGTGWYVHEDRELFAISVWHEDKWKDLIYGGALKAPAVFISVPKILGVENVRFLWENPRRDIAFRCA